MHVLRHMRSVPEEYARTLVGKRYEYYDVRKKKFVRAVVTTRATASALRTKGKSKFFANLVGFETPKKIIALIRRESRKRRLRWIDNGKYRTAKFTLMHKTFVGTDIPERSKRRTHRVGVEIVWYKGERSAYVTAYPCLYD